MSSEESKSVNFVIVKIALKSNEKSEVEGYFTQLKPLVQKDFEVIKADDMYIWLYTKGVVYMHSLNHYYISQIVCGQKVGDRNETSYKSYKNIESEQNSAKELLKELIVSMEKSGLIKHHGLIDCDKYIDVPTYLKDNLDVAGGIKPKPVESKSSTYCSGYRNTPVITPYVAKVVSTSIMKRTINTNASEMLAAMLQNIKAIEENTYAPKDRTKIPADDLDILHVQLEEETPTKHNETKTYNRSGFEFVEGYDGYGVC